MGKYEENDAIQEAKMANFKYPGVLEKLLQSILQEQLCCKPGHDTVHSESNGVRPMKLG